MTGRCVLISSALGAAFVAVLGFASVAAAQQPAYPYPPGCDGELIIDTSGLGSVVGDPVDALAYGFTPSETVTLAIGTVVVQTLPADSTGSVTFTAPIPGNAPLGQQDARATGAMSQCVQTAAIDVVEPTTMRLSITPAHPTTRSPVTVRANLSGLATVDGGVVDFTVDGLPIDSTTVSKSIAGFVIRPNLEGVGPNPLSAGTHDLSAEYFGTDTQSGTASDVSFDVSRAASKVRLTLSAHRVARGTPLSGLIRVAHSDGGNALITYAGHHVTVMLGRHHRARFDIDSRSLPVGRDRVTARYAGSAQLAPSATAIRYVHVTRGR